MRTCLERLVGGATEETIIARVGEGIVSAIGSARSHKDVLENPDRISRAVLEKGLDSETAYNILSIDIADVDVGENIGARLQAEQAEANRKMAIADAEKKAAYERARQEEMRAEVIKAEAEVPKAIADAFRKGNLGIMDYLRIKNIQADTNMRDSIGGKGDRSDTDTPKI